MLAGVLLAGCSGIRTVTSDVSRRFGEWPAERQPGTYAFDRLPSQAARRPRTPTELEAAARPALEKAGFKAGRRRASRTRRAGAGGRARTARADAYPWDDPLWWRGGFG